MTPQPQKEYIITFEELQELKPDVADGMYRSTKEMNQEKTIFRVLSRSRPAPSPDCMKCTKAADGYCLGKEEGAAQAREKVLEQLSDLNRYACQEYDEASCSDNEREMRIHLEYGNRTWGIIRSLRTGGEP